MDAVCALHTAARCYCIDRARALRESASALRAAPVKDKRHPEIELAARNDELRVLADRYHTVDRILEEIEQFVPQDFASLDEARSLLGLGAQAVKGSQPWPPLIQSPDAADERHRYVEYLNQLSSSDLAAVPPLPFRRRLPAVESERWWTMLHDHWQVRGTAWSPIIDVEVPGNGLVLQADWFHCALTERRLQQIVADHGVSRIWECREDRRVSELDLELFEPYYNGLEGFWTSTDSDWLIYASHESSITIAGEWFVNAVKQAWLGWQDHLYAGWDYERPPQQL